MAARSRKPPFFELKTFSEQIRPFFVYHPMKLLILGLLAFILLAAAASGPRCFWGWRSDVREQTWEAREQAREFRRQQREEMHRVRDEIRAERDRIRDEIRANVRDNIRESLRRHHDWDYTY